MALRVINHYPAINAVDIPKNASVKVVFNSGIVPQSVLPSTFSVNDATTYTTKVGTLGVEYNSSGICDTVVFQPYVFVNGSGVISPFTANRKYRVYLFNSPNSVVSTSNEQLVTAYMFEFTVGTGLLIDPFPEGIPSGELPTSGTVEVDGIEVDSGIYSDLIASGFRVIGTTPQNQTPNVAVNLSSIYIQFNTDIATPVADMSGYVTLTSEDVLY